MLGLFAGAHTRFCTGGHQTLFGPIGPKIGEAPNPGTPAFQHARPLLFHREGRIGDANAKLEETVKLLCIHYACGANPEQFNSVYERLLARHTFSVGALNDLFRTVALQPPFTGPAGNSIFGPNPSTAFEQIDEPVAYGLFIASARAFRIQAATQSPLDVLNEAFGHHVRDNFRSHIEDAQYMTPPEVVDFMAAAASHFVARKRYEQEEFVMADPSCGVGSFLAAWRREYASLGPRVSALPPLKIVGQDKVGRMARLSTLNLIFSGNAEGHIFVGNSLIDGSPLDAMNGCVDLILTNPPFGAKFPRPQVRTRSQTSTPIFAKSQVGFTSADSELLFIDRYLSLLRPGGLCLVVVPDGVVSAKGLSAYLRQELARRALVLGVVALPPVTFAQAGTRTKTVILIFEKASIEPERPTRVFLGEVSDLGYEVSKRKGVPIKRSTGENQLPALLEVLKEGRDSNGSSGDCFAVFRDVDLAECDAWTPRQFAVKQGKPSASDRSTLLKDLVVDLARRRPERHSKEKYYLSVLHVIGEGVLDVAGIMTYRPVTPGIPVFPGEVLISRINPRIPRVLVVPTLDKPLLCSSEFEVLKPKEGIDPYAIAYLLLTSIVQSQIQAQTAGTSASHSRVKPKKLLQTQIPWPAVATSRRFKALMANYKTTIENLLIAQLATYNLRKVGDKDFVLE